MIRVADLADMFRKIDRPWTPHVVGRVNEHAVKLAKLDGPFVWHSHAAEDELFLVVLGRLRMKIREASGEREVVVAPGQFVIIPRGVEHLPIADEETHVLLFEPASTLNIGNADDSRRLDNPPEM